MLGDIRRHSMSFIKASPRRREDWVLEVNRLDPKKTETPEFALFKKTFSDPQVSMKDIFPRLSPRGIRVVLETFPNRAPDLMPLKPELAASALKNLSSDKFFSILFTLIEENGELSKETVQVADEKMKAMPIIEVLKGLASSPVEKFQKTLFYSLSFEMQLLIYGNASPVDYKFLCVFTSQYRKMLSGELTIRLEALIRCFDQMPIGQWQALVSLMDNEQAMTLLTFLTVDQFKSVSDVYREKVKALIEEQAHSELTYWLRQCSNPKLQRMVQIMLKKTELTEIKDYFVIDRALTQHYLLRTLNESGNKKRQELVAEMNKSDQFFSIQRFYSLLEKVITSPGKDAKGVRRALLVASKFLESRPEMVCQLAPQLKEMTAVTLSDTAAKKLQGQLTEEVEGFKKEQMARDLVDYLQKGTLSAAEVVFGFLYVTTVKHMMAEIHRSLHEKPTKSATKHSLAFLASWLSTIATEEDFLECQDQLNEIKDLSLGTRTFNKFLNQLEMKQKIVQLDIDSTESSSSQIEPIDFQKVMKSRFKNQRYLGDLQEISLDLKEYALSLFSQIQFTDYICLDWMGGAVADSPVSHMIQEWNSLAESAQSMIVDEALKKSGRGRIIESFIDLAYSLYEQGDFHSSFAIYSAVLASDRKKLQVSWNRVRTKYKKKKASLDEIFNPQGNFQLLRQKMKEMAESGWNKVCPGIYLMSHDLEPITGNYPNLVGDHLSVTKVKLLSERFAEFYHLKVINQKNAQKRTRSTAVQTLFRNRAGTVDRWTSSQKCQTVG